MVALEKFDSAAPDQLTDGIYPKNITMITNTPDLSVRSGNLSRFLKQYKMHLLHNLKIRLESEICSYAHVDDWMGLKMGEGV